MEITDEIRNNILLLTISECCTHEDFSELYDQLTNFIVDKRTTKLMVDITAVSIVPETLFTFEKGKEMADVFMKHNSLGAFLINSVLLEQMSFFEDVLVNRGAQVKVFVDDKPAAVEWLNREN